VIYEGREYGINVALIKARQVLKDQYKDENAIEWIKTHLYRSPSSGEIIYLKSANGEVKPLRDAFVEDLKSL